MHVNTGTEIRFDKAPTRVSVSQKPYDKAQIYFATLNSKLNFCIQKL